MRVFKSIIHVICFPFLLIIAIPFGIVEIYREFDKFLDR